MKQEIEQALLSNGFSQKEAKIYLIILEMGESTVSQIANKTGIKRSTVYNVMQEMQTKGLVSITTRRGTQYASALAPFLLLERYKHSYHLLQGISQGLLQIADSSALKPQIQFFEGIEGIKHCYLQIESAQGDVIGFTNYENMPEEVFKFIRNTFIPIRKKRKIPARFITPQGAKNEKIAKEDPQYFIEHKINKNLPGDVNLELFLLNQSDCFFLSFEKGEVFGIMLRSKAVYQMIRILFELMWKE
jgi:HTH-type transcriptional regulator, sugar sensing transcriptional regulator